MTEFLFFTKFKNSISKKIDEKIFGRKKSEKFRIEKYFLVGEKMENFDRKKLFSEIFLVGKKFPTKIFENFKISNFRFFEFRFFSDFFLVRGSELVISLQKNEISRG